MEVFEAMETRISRRGFLPKKVEKATLEKILKAVNRCPSYMNTQPWEVFVATGAKKENLAKKLYELTCSGAATSPDFPLPKSWPQALDERAKGHRMRRFKALGIDPDKDQDKVIASNRSNFKFFDAPCAIFMTIDKTLTSWSIFDCGAFVYAFLLAAHAEGLGACAQAMPTNFPGPIRAELGIPDHLAIVICISVGYPNLELPTNKYQSLRRDIHEYIHWCGF
jgi:nitroreductase